MKLQVNGNYIYITLWDKQAKKPRRFYLGRKEDFKKMEELFRIAKEYRITKQEITDYLEYYFDKRINLTKIEYVILSLSLGVELWELNGNIRMRLE
ncbi:hypothetical protein [Saccharolobus shibatae]|uniref:hypothetical protein n=1 Tax=Saccharolobus shibatae TaxID=2286 RepID=UPI001C452485|nr:hypothetical protein [Saccharolobus shibatae]